MEVLCKKVIKIYQIGINLHETYQHHPQLTELKGRATRSNARGADARGANKSPIRIKYFFRFYRFIILCTAFVNIKFYKLVSNVKANPKNTGCNEKLRKELKI